MKITKEKGRRVKKGRYFTIPLDDPAGKEGKYFTIPDEEQAAGRRTDSLRRQRGRLQRIRE